MNPLFTALDVVAVILTAYFLTSILARRGRGPLPPGPRGWPLIGNVFDMPRSHGWTTFAEWGRKWGDIISINLLGQPMVILNSFQLAVDLLDKKSANYSERPILPVGGEIVGFNETLVLLPSGTTFREHRRLFAQVVGSRSRVAQLASVLEAQTSRCLLHILCEPGDVSRHLRKTTATIILLISHGYQTKEGDDPIAHIVKVAVDEFSSLTAPGAFLADVFPFLQHLPSWVPGTGWKKDIPMWIEHLRDMNDLPFNFVKEQMAAGTALPSFVSSNLSEGISAEQEHVLKLAATSFYSGGADTTVALTNIFLLVMMHHPEVQKKAQLEIDRVIGNERLPSLADRDHLPYVNSVVLELFRWNPIVPLAVAHCSREDDFHAGYFIPKGTLVIPNVWKFLHDPNDYANPFEFNPDRFMPFSRKKPERDPREFAFGFGRRICPGRHLGEASVFITCAMSLAVFDICKPMENGVEVEPKIEFTSGTIVHPLPFKCSVKPRSAKAESLIRSVNRDMQE